MPEHVKPENLLENFMETFRDSIPRQNPLTIFQDETPVEEKETPILAKTKKLFGRQNTIHKVLGGGKSADVLLWRNKKISFTTLLGATAIWVLFEWLNYNFLTLLFSALAIGTTLLFVWSKTFNIRSRSSSQIPRFVLPDELFLNVAVTVGAEVNRFLCFLQDAATDQNIKEICLVVAGLWVSAIIGNWCNFLTVVYAGFVAAHTLPVLYEKYEDEIDAFVCNLLGQLQDRCKNLDSSVLRKLPRSISKKFR